MSYDEAPTQKIFDQIRQAAIDIWTTYDDTHDYASEKIAQVNELLNYRDNWYTMVGMFDRYNQTKLLNKGYVEAALKVLEGLE